MTAHCQLPPSTPIRIATRADEPEIIVLCKELHAENAIFTMSEPKLRAKLATAFERKGGIVGLIGAPGAVEAIMFLSITTDWYSDDWYIAELFSFVRPAFRKSTHAKALVAWAKRCADECKLPLLTGILSNTQTIAKVRLYRRQLAEPRGAFFAYNLPGAAEMPAPAWPFEKPERKAIN